MIIFGQKVPWQFILLVAGVVAYLLGIVMTMVFDQNPNISNDGWVSLTWLVWLLLVTGAYLRARKVSGKTEAIFFSVVVAIVTGFILLLVSLSPNPPKDVLGDSP